MENTMKQYGELIQDSLFEEAYMLLEQNVKKIDDTISKNKHIRNFFTAIFNDNVLNVIIEENNLLPLAIATTNSLKNSDFFKPIIPKFANFVDSNKIMLMFAFLIQKNEFDNAKFLLQYFNNNLIGFPKTLEVIIKDNNINALKFICTNMENIHCNEDSLLRMSFSMPPVALRMLIEDFDFDINEQSAKTGENLIHILIQTKNIKNFKFIVENYGLNINWGLLKNKISKDSTPTFFDMIDEKKLQSELYSIMLNDMSLKVNFLDRIANSLFSSSEVINNCCDTEVYNKLFSHQNFNPNEINLGQCYFLYGLLTELGTVAKTSKSEEAIKPYFKILNSYVKACADEDIPFATNVHIIGAAIHIAKNTGSMVAGDALGLILRRYNKYINVPNPGGELPIMQVEKDSAIYRILINNGAITPEPEPGFWGSMISVFRKKQATEEIQKYVPEVKKSEPINGNLISLKNQMREDFRIMRNYLSNVLCDTTIKFKCENMFLRAEKLVNMMEKHGVNQQYEDMHFLGENFSSYLKESLSSYISVCQATVDLSANDKKLDKLNFAKQQCMEQVDLLAEQLSLISENVFNEVEGNASRNLNVRGRFLKNRFPETQDFSMEQMIDNNMLSINKINDENNSNKSFKDMVDDLKSMPITQNSEDLNNTIVDIIKSSTENVKELSNSQENSKKVEQVTSQQIVDIFQNEKKYI